MTIVASAGAGTNLDLKKKMKYDLVSVEGNWKAQDRENHQRKNTFKNKGKQKRK